MDDEELIGRLDMVCTLLGVLFGLRDDRAMIEGLITELVELIEAGRDPNAGSILKQHGRDETLKMVRTVLNKSTR